MKGKTIMKRAISVIISVMIILGCIPVSLVAHAADDYDWIYVQSLKLEPTTIYTKVSTAISAGKTYLLGELSGNSGYILNATGGATAVTSSNAGATSYYNQDGSVYTATAEYIVGTDTINACAYTRVSNYLQTTAGTYLGRNSTSIQYNSTAGSSNSFTYGANSISKSTSYRTYYLCRNNASFLFSTSKKSIYAYEQKTVYERKGSETGAYYALTGNKSYDIAIGANFNIDTIRTGSTIMYKTSATGSLNTLSWDSEELSYSFDTIDTSTPGNYTMQIYAYDVSLGTITVNVAENPNVTPVSVPNKLSIEAECSLNGTVPLDGISFQLLMSDGTYRTVPVTESMLSSYSTDTAGTKTITIDYSETINAGTIKLNVGEAEQEVNLEKRSYFFGNSFMETGIANIELSISGKHAESGSLDVLVISDVSNSMAWGANASSAQYNYNPANLSDTLSKMESMKNSISEFAGIVLGDLSKGTNTMSMVTFGGYDAERVTATSNYVDATRTLFTSLSTKEAVDDYLNRIKMTMTGDSDTSTNKSYSLQLPNGASGTVSGTNKGGTNYDWGFWQGKQAIEQIYADYANSHNGASYADSGRSIVVLFMSDGAPTYYNQTTNNTEKNNLYYGKSGTTDYDIYYNYYKYKGLTLSSYQNTFYNQYYYTSSGTQMNLSGGASFAAYFDYTPNLGAQVVRNMPGVYDMVAVGYHLETGGSNNYTYNESQLTTLMGHLYDSEKGNDVYTASNSAELEQMFKTIANEFVTTVNAVVFDAVGESFELIRSMKSSSGMDLKVDNNFEPSITVTKDDVVVEKITFNNDGTEAYSTLLSGNIMDLEGNITASTFTFTAAEKKLTWTIGELGHETYKISYFAYLTGSQEGTLPRGEYKTNEYAYAIVDSENPEEIKNFVDDFDVPSLSWYDIFVSVKTEVANYENLSEAKKQKINTMDFVYYAYFNDETSSTPTPMTGYTYDVYDDEGEYLRTDTVEDDGKITLSYAEQAIFNQNHVGAIRITQSPSTAYSTDNWTSSSTIDNTTDNSSGSTSPIESTQTNFDAENDPSTIYNIDYVCTVSLKPDLVPDVVVLDYGKTIFTDPMLNDVEAVGYELYGLYPTTPVSSEKPLNSVKLTNGNVNVDNSSGGVIYTPFRYMSSIDRVYYYLAPEGTEANLDSDNTNLVYSTITYIPATSVYYEDDFGGSAENGGLYIEYTGDWYTVDDEGNQSSGVSVGTNANDKQDRGEVGQGNTPYGYDSTYDNCIKFSNGSASKVTGTVSLDPTTKKPTFNATAQFTFTGTGFDVISRTDLDCGMITVYVTDENGKSVNMPVINKGTGTLYQIPVISFMCEDYFDNAYGTYTVKINVNAPSAVLNITGSVFYLDAIRIYNPMGNSSDDNAEFDEANAAYNADHEANEYIASIRDYILQAGKLDETEQYGAVYVDTINNEYSGSGMLDDDDYDKDNPSEEKKGTSGMDVLNYRVLNQSLIKDFELIGPNEEVYLSPGYGVGFILETTKQPASVQLEMKIPAPIQTGASLSVYTFGKTSNIGKIDINSAAEMFYDITDEVIFTQTDGVYRAVVVLENGLPSTNAGEIVSITNLKLTYDDDVVALDAADEDSLFTLDGVDEENVALTSLKASWNTYEDVFDSVYTHKEASTPNYEITDIDTVDKTQSGKIVTATVKTSKYVDDLIIMTPRGNVVSPISVTSTVDESKVLTDEYKQAKTWVIKFPVYGTDDTTVEYTIESTNGTGGISTMEFEIDNVKVSKIEVYNKPKTSYKVGESFDSTGMTLKVTYVDGTEKIISSGYATENVTFAKAGKQNVNVSFGGKTTTVKVTVTQTFVQAVKSFFAALARFKFSK